MTAKEDITMNQMKPIEHVKTVAIARANVPDGFGCEIELCVRAEGHSHLKGDNCDPRIEAEIKFSQQHEVQLVNEDHVILKAWGCEAKEMPNVFRALADLAARAMEEITGEPAP